MKGDLLLTVFIRPALNKPVYLDNIMLLNHLFEKKGALVFTTKHQHLYHLTDNHGLGLSVEGDALKALRQNYISTTYRAETTDILGRQGYHYKFILKGPELAKEYGIFPYDHHVTEIGNGHKRKSVSANEAELGVNTRSISPLKDYLDGVVILLKPYTEHLVLFLADVNVSRTGFLDVEKTGTIPAVTALNRLKGEGVPLFWQNSDGDFEPFNDRDYEYLRDIEMMMREIETTNRTQRHLDILERLLDKYDIKSSHFMDTSTIDKNIIARRRVVPKMMAALNAYYHKRPLADIKPEALRTMMAYFLKLMGYGSNVLSAVLSTADASGFFHPVTAPVKWTSFLRDLVAGNIEDALAEIKACSPSQWQIDLFNKGERQGYHDGTGMAGDH